MILNCPKCKKTFPLHGRPHERFDVGEYMNCRECGYLATALDFVGIIRVSELLEWTNAWNASLVILNQIEREKQEKKIQKKPKSIWDVVVADSALRKILVGEKKLKETDSSPTLRFIVRSTEKPSRDFILGKFKEHLNEIYQFGYIDPFIQCTCMCIAAEGRFFDV